MAWKQVGNQHHHAPVRLLPAVPCRSGPLAFTNTAQLHLGYDGWYNKEKQVRGNSTEHCSAVLLVVGRLVLHMNEHCRY